MHNIFNLRTFWVKSINSQTGPYITITHDDVITVTTTTNTLTIGASDATISTRGVVNTTARGFAGDKGFLPARSDHATARLPLA